MNKTFVRRVATALLNAELATRKRGTKIGYNQAAFGVRGYCFPDQTGHDCGTTACIAGWAVALDGLNPLKVYNVAKRARKLLGLTDNQAAELFSGSVISKAHGPTSQDAALVLYNLAETGKVDWNVAQPNV